VLPFTDISEQAADGDLGATLAEGVSDEIGSIDTVTVASSVAGANWVVGGAVQQLEDAVQVTARIVETRAGSIVRTVRVDGAASELPRLRQATARAVARSLADALNVTAAGTPAAPAPAAAAVQVRPFANLSQAPADDTLAREVGEAVVAHLGRTGTFTVVDSEDAARWIVAGGIQRVGDLIRITARLVDVREGSVVRAVKVDGAIEELMRLQDEVASAMSSGVREAGAGAEAEAG
jgi:TolB-like protein